MASFVPPLGDVPVSRGYAVVVTIVDRLRKSKEPVALAVWPESEAGRLSRDVIYDGFPRVRDDSHEARKGGGRFAITVDRVGPALQMVVEARHIPVPVGEALLEDRLPVVLARVRRQKSLGRLSLEAFQRALASKR